VGAPLVALIIGFGQEAGLLFLILLATGLGLVEFYRLTLPESLPSQRILGIGLGLLFPLAAFLGREGAVVAVLALVVLVLFLLLMVTPGELAGATSRMAVMLLGNVYVGFLLSYIVLLRGRPMGLQWVLFLLVTVWAGDTCAYFSGTLVGRHRLWPRISPNKTLEGLLGGLAGSVAAAVLFRLFFLRCLALSDTVTLGSFILMIGQVGDFGESMIKRSARVKDSSHLIPGHGGVLDRLDSLLLSAPFLYYYVQWILG